MLLPSSRKNQARKEETSCLLRLKEYTSSITCLGFSLLFPWGRWRWREDGIPSPTSKTRSLAWSLRESEADLKGRLRKDRGSMSTGRWSEQTPFPVSEPVLARRSQVTPNQKAIDLRSHRRRATSAKKGLCSPSLCSNLLTSPVKRCLCYFTRQARRSKWQRPAKKAKEKSMKVQGIRSKKEITTIQKPIKTSNGKDLKETREAQSQKISYPKLNPKKVQWAKQS